jgi:SAM-dependent methyltransferase
MDLTIDERATAQLAGTIGQWDQGIACLAALAVATEPGATGPLGAAAQEVIAAAGLGDVLASLDRLPFTPAQLHGMAASPLLQAAALIDGPYDGWAGQSEATLTAQGQASGSAVVLFARFLLPHYSGLAERLAAPGARMLDVGTGIGALAIGCAQAFPQLHVTAIDVLPRVLDIARTHVDASPVATRVELRQQDVAELTDTARYDLAWIPAPFVPEPAFSAGVARMVNALRPGGVLMVGHGTFDGSELDSAITRFKTIANGGTPLDGPSAARLLDELGLDCVQTVPTPPGAPRITAGRR